MSEDPMFKFLRRASNEDEAHARDMLGMVMIVVFIVAIVALLLWGAWA